MLPRGDAKPRAARPVRAHTPCPQPDLLPGLWKPLRHPGGHPSPSAGVSIRGQQGWGMPHTSTPVVTQLVWATLGVPRCAPPEGTDGSRAGWPVPTEVAAVPHTHTHAGERCQGRGKRQEGFGKRSALLPCHAMPGWLTRWLPATMRRPTGLHQPTLPCAAGTAVHRDGDCGWVPSTSVQGGIYGHRQRWVMLSWPDHGHATSSSPDLAAGYRVPPRVPRKMGFQGTVPSPTAGQGARRGERGEPGVCRERSEDPSDGFAGSSRTRTSPGQRDAEPPPNSACRGGGRAASPPPWLWGPPGPKPRLQ